MLACHSSEDICLGSGKCERQKTCCGVLKTKQDNGQIWQENTNQHHLHQVCQTCIITASLHDVPRLIFPIIKLGVASVWHIWPIGREFDSPDLHCIYYCSMIFIKSYALINTKNLTALIRMKSMFTNFCLPIVFSQYKFMAGAEKKIIQKVGRLQVLQNCILVEKYNSSLSLQFNLLLIF